MEIKLYPHQLDALERMDVGCILNGSVGSGKSRTGIAFYFLKNGGDLQDVEKIENLQDLYIITTPRKRDSKEWDGELAPFVLSENPELNYHGNTVVIDSWNNIKKYEGIENAFFIFDEQRVVGYGAWVKSFLKITKKNDWILLSATPGDQWTDYIPVFIANGFYKNKTDFCNQHVVWKPRSKFPQVQRYLDEGHLNYLRRKILVPMKYKSQHEQKHIVIDTTYDKDLYKFVTKNRWDIYNEKPIKNVAGLCYIWRRICNADQSRSEAVLNIVRDEKRVIIFYNFDYELELLLGLDYGDYEVRQWNGHLHEPVPKSEKWVYLVQYSSGNEAWNCTETNVMIFYSQTYSYKILKQAAGRIDRQNSPFDELYYYHLRSKSPIDIAIARCLNKKENFNEKSFVLG